MVRGVILNTAHKMNLVVHQLLGYLNILCSLVVLKQ